MTDAAILKLECRKLTWEAFEAKPNGELKGPGGKTIFKMRVGLILGRPMQVIIADGQYVRMRAAPRWDPELWELSVLDPANPDKALRTFNKRINRTLWRPSVKLIQLMLRGHPITFNDL